MNDNLLNEKFKNIEKILDKHDIQLDKLNTVYDSIHELCEEIKELVVEVKNIKEDQVEIKSNISKQDDRLRAIEQEPSDEFKNLKWLIIATVVTALLTYVLTGVGIR